MPARHEGGFDLETRELQEIGGVNPLKPEEPFNPEPLQPEES